MEIKLDEKTLHSIIKVCLKDLDRYKLLIQTYISLYGGEEIRRSSKYVYFKIYSDLLNKKG